MKILYFTATGNCLYVAKRIGGELLSIPQLQRNGIYDINDDVVGIIAPIYSWDIARPVRFYLKNVNIKADYVFLILTYGLISMAAISEMENVLLKRNIKLNYSNEIQMVDNFLPIFEMNNQMKCRKEKTISKKIDKIINDIDNRKNNVLKKIWLKRYFTKIMSTKYLSENGMEKLNYMDKEFIVNNDCDGCGICRNVCPIKNITGINRPEYLNKCEFCLACIHHCPKKAIHLKNERSNARYINPNIKLSEIINANK
jgi:ferredoxin